MLLTLVRLVKKIHKLGWGLTVGWSRKIFVYDESDGTINVSVVGSVCDLFDAHTSPATYNVDKMEVTNFHMQHVYFRKYPYATCKQFSIIFKNTLEFMALPTKAMLEYARMC
ncbi:hypothetical protein OTU49_005194 [Cherax quadricarinatus]|uniref:Uncharacterized protein n=1 Tax=Cherax quadricarinatus TaxID=27406 RepID=A0AAW0X8E5_CHEQU